MVRTTGHTARIVYTDCGAEQHRPDEPERAKQRELVFCNTANIPSRLRQCTAILEYERVDELLQW